MTLSVKVTCAFVSLLIWEKFSPTPTYLTHPFAHRHLAVWVGRRLPGPCPGAYPRPSAVPAPIERLLRNRRYFPVA